MKSNLAVICLSNQFYDLPLKTNKHLVMDELVKKGHRVIFVNPPTRYEGIKKFIKNKTLIDKKKENFYIYTPINFFNFFPFSWLSNIFHSYIIKKIVSSFSAAGINTPLIPPKGRDLGRCVLWAYHFDFPRVFDLKNKLHPDVFIYDVVDDYASFPEYARRDITYKKRSKMIYYLETLDRFFKELIDQKGKKGKDWVEYRERNLAKIVDIMFASHPILYKKFKKLNKNTYYTPNAGAYELYSKKPKAEPEELKNIKRPIVGYSGALDAYKFDVDLFLYTAKKTSDINYVLIGPLQLSDSNPKVEELKNLENVYLVGTKSFEETAVYTHYFDSYIIPYQVNDYTYKGCFPVKFFNALATGTPVVVTNLPAYEEFEEVLSLAKDKEGFLDMVKKSVKDKDLKKKKKRIRVASENTWKKKVDKQLKAIEEYLDKIYQDNK